MNCVNDVLVIDEHEQITCDDNILFSFEHTEDPRYNDRVCYQRFCCKIEFAVIKKLDRSRLKQE